MMAETVVIDVQPVEAFNGNGIARVTANFTLHNLGTESEAMAVRFPISANDGFFNYPEIKDFQARVDGRRLNTRRITIPDLDNNNYPLPWVEFDVIFAPGKDVLIDVAYTLEGVSEYPYVNFEYLLETGAGWQGTIGSADLIVRLPYDANPYNVLLDSSWGMGQTSPGAAITGREIRWHYDDLEPTIEHNLSVALLLPSAWKAVLTEQENVERNPQDGEAWGRLGKAYKTISRLRRGLREDAGGLELFNLGIEAYEKAVAILPKDALWHAGFAELLFDGYYWQEYSSAEKPGLLRAVGELARAYELKPGDPFILELSEEFRSALPHALRMDGDRLIFLWLTATPTRLPSPLPSATNTPAPTATLLPETLTPDLTSTLGPTATTMQIANTPTVQPATASPEPETQQSVQVCGVSVFFPLAIVALVLLRRRDEN